MPVNQQPEAYALILADTLDLLALQTELRKAAAELRRLHSLNVELLEALKGLLDVTDFHELYGKKTEAARAAIAKATGDQPCQ